MNYIRALILSSMFGKIISVLSAAVLLTSVSAYCGPVSDVLPRPAELRFGQGYLKMDAGDILSSARVSYVLEVSGDSVIIEAGDSAGLFYAWQTLSQLAGVPLEVTETAHGPGSVLQAVDSVRIPCVTVRDSPRFAWRGYMQDVSRHFFDIGFLKKQIDAMAALKLNRLHLHLTDAAGWRVEIDR